ncbi:hypothetical protein [Streptomyces griseomycini]|uniref:Integral membrane protein n=1 Tax=Streptomyces griseomycini TaxID=66895 RepID=A0A7W7V8K6_9ACTN|nr:hypothetical protein [Streptomyces griseomycini]MBB4901185.1 hypothetical protein [Streptomyces griseomycini]GGP88958.1 hypothetical protein GCM10010266_10450 [Streptomyces griseomycini]GGR17516.1 hypothetical protein GCM10015536_24060 [Streptomyces griseomycini]
MRPRTRVLLLAALFAVLQLANVTGRDTPDTKNYLSYALSLGGEGKREAAAATVEYVCAGRASIAHRAQNVDVVRFHAPDPAPRVLRECRDRELGQVRARLAAGQTGGHTVPFMPERFMRIFEVRPGYPAFLVPFVTLFGVTWGVWAASVVVACAGGVLAFLVLRTLSVPVPLALAGQALFYVLPCGTTAMRPMTEGLLLALTLAALWGCALALTGRRPRAGGALAAAALLALFTVKHSQALFLGLGLAGAGAAVAVRRRRRGLPPGRAAVALTGVGCAGVLGTVLLARLLHYPSVAESVQDLLTGHFARPDRERPWAEFFQLQGNFWTEWLRRQLWEPVFLAGTAAGLWGAWRRPVFGAFLVAAAGTGFLNQAGHPDINIWGDRLIVLAWLLPVLGVPQLLERVVRERAAVPAQGAPVEPVR